MGQRCRCLHLGGCAQPAPPRIQRIATLPSLLGALALLGAGLLLPAAVSAERGPSRSSNLPTLVQSTTAQAEARVIVKFRSSSKAVLAAGRNADRQVLQQAGTLGTRHGLTLRDGPMAGPRLQVIRASGLTSAALAARLATDSEVEYAVPDGRKRAHAAPSDRYYAGGSGVDPVAGQWYLRAPSATFVSSVNAEAAWAHSTGSADVVVAVLDTGVRSKHPDLVGKLLPGYDFVSSTTISNDSNGRDDDPSDPGDWTTEAENNNASGEFYECGPFNSLTGRYEFQPSTWHGTQTTGLVAAATNNGTGIAGMGRHVRVLPVRVLGKCIGYDSDILAGIYWAAGIPYGDVSGQNPVNPNPAKVINLSLGSSGACDSLYQDAIDAVRARGVVVVVSAGNDNSAVNAPANCSGVVAVAGLRHLGTKNGYSSFGSAVTVSAPAGNCVNQDGACLYPITSTSNTGTTSPSCPIYTGSGSNYAVGTSFSAPIVAGTLALMRAANPTLTPDGLIALLRSSARTFPTTGADADVPACPQLHPESGECYCNTSTCGAGMLDAGAAVQAAAAGRTLARIEESSSQVGLGGSTLLSGTGSQSTSGGSLTYLWNLLDPTLASFNGSTSSSTASLTANATGTALVRLTVDDGSGGNSSAIAVLRTGQAPDATCESEPTNPGSDSGGGGFDAASLAAGLIALAVLALRHPRRRS